MLWALVGRTNLLSVATKLDVPVFHAKRVELGCTRHVRVNSSVSKGFSSLFLFQAVQNYERSSRCIRKQRCTVLSTKACSGDTQSVSLAVEGHRQGNGGSDVKCACAHSDAFRPDPSLGVLLPSRLALRKRGKLQALCTCTSFIFPCSRYGVSPGDFTKTSAALVRK